MALTRVAERGAPGAIVPGRLFQRPRFFAGLRKRHDPHSMYLATVAGFMSFTLVLDVWLHRGQADTWVLVAMLFGTLSLGIAALWMGARLPRWTGLAAVGVFTLATVYFLSPLGDVQSAVASAQELPIVALYLGWFVPRPLGRIVFVVITAVLVTVMALNPVFSRSGPLGVATAVQAVLMALLCFEIGSILWRRLQRRITTDHLTGVLNRAGFFQRLARARERAARTAVPLCLAVIDFDDFKQLNDTLGHHAGDEALHAAVAEWQAALRPGDVIGRTGGDEFAILLHRVDAHEAIQIMERLRADASYAWTWGVAQVRAGDTDEALFIRADRQLYLAKDRRHAS